MLRRRRPGAVATRPAPHREFRPMRAARVLVLFGVTVLLVSSTPPARSAASSDALARQRAIATYAAMQRYFYVPATHAYRGIYGQRGHAQVWPYSQALWAAIELARIPRVGRAALADLRALVAGLRAYGIRTRGGIVYNAVWGERTYVFYDDNAWIGLALIDAAALLRDRTLLEKAREVFSPIEAGWDSNPTDPCPGGVYWIRSAKNHERATVSTANGALIAALLYRRTHVPAYLGWARRAYRWTRQCLATPTGLVADHIDSTGTIDTHTWSYNQGAMIAAGVALYLDTGDRSYLDDARATADAELASLQDPLGSGESASFLAIFYRDLLSLAAVDPSPRYRLAVESFADAAWSTERSASTGLFSFGHTRATLLDQAAMVQVYAALAAS